jgi:hypothetical protein
MDQLTATKLPAILCRISRHPSAKSTGTEIPWKRSGKQLVPDTLPGTRLTPPGGTEDEGHYQGEGGKVSARLRILEGLGHWGLGDRGPDVVGSIDPAIAANGSDRWRRLAPTSLSYP